MCLFVAWCIAEAMDWTSSVQIDAVAVEYLNYLFNDGELLHRGTSFLAALKFFFPQFGRDGLLRLPRCSRALRGWSKKRPPLQRVPLPRLVVMAIIGLLLFDSNVAEALGVFLSFHCYLRPGEFENLKVHNLVFGQAVANGPTQWGLLMHMQEDLKPSKIGLFDEAVIIDAGHWINLLLEIVARSPSQQQLLNMQPGQLKTAFLAACQKLHLAHLLPCLYQLRHAGASDDMLQARRVTADIRARGRWQSDNSLKRYSKPTQVLRELQRVSLAVKALGSFVDSHLATVFHIPKSIPSVLVGKATSHPAPKN